MNQVSYACSRELEKKDILQQDDAKIIKLYDFLIM